MRDLVRVASLALVMSVRAEAQPTLHTLLDSAIHAEVKNGFSGAVLVTRRGTIVLDKTYGSARGPLETPTRFWIASAAKQFTSVAILYCKEKGWLSLDDPIVKFFPDAPADKRAITVWQLLSHTSGLRQSYVSETLDDRATAVQRMLAEPLASAPGARFGYSNNNYQLAVAIVEVASGKPYREYIQQLWDRAALNGTGFAGEAGATSVASVPSGLPERLTRTYWGGEGGFSTTGDLLIWYRALRGGKLLSPPNVDTLFTSIAPIQEGAAALGWFVGKSSRGARTVFTRGNEDFGANALFYAYPESDIVIIVLTHAGSTSDGTSWSRFIHGRIEELMSL